MLVPPLRPPACRESAGPRVLRCAAARAPAARERLAIAPVRARRVHGRVRVRLDTPRTCHPGGVARGQRGREHGRRRLPRYACMQGAQSGRSPVRTGLARAPGRGSGTLLRPPHTPGGEHCTIGRSPEPSRPTPPPPPRHLPHRCHMTTRFGKLETITGEVFDRTTFWVLAHDLSTTPRRKNARKNFMIFFDS